VCITSLAWLALSTAFLSESALTVSPLLPRPSSDQQYLQEVNRFYIMGHLIGCGCLEQSREGLPRLRQAVWARVPGRLCWRAALSSQGVEIIHWICLRCMSSSDSVEHWKSISRKVTSSNFHLRRHKMIRSPAQVCCTQHHSGCKLCDWE